MSDLVPLNDAQWGAQTVAYTGTAGTVTGWPYGPGSVWLFCTTDAYVKVGSGVTATTANLPVPARVAVRIPVPKEENVATWTVSAIQISSGGTLFAKPCQDQ